MRILRATGSIDERRLEDDVVEVARKSRSVRLGDLHIGDYNGWIVGVSPLDDEDEGTLIYVPNVSPEKLIEGDV